MKLFSLFILVVTGTLGSVNACVCSPFPDESMNATVSRYDFIANIRVKSIRTQTFFTENDGNKSDFAQIEILELFKGVKVDSLHIWGIGSSCDMGMRPGDEWIIFGNKKEGNFSTNICTRSLRVVPGNWSGDKPFFSTLLYTLKKHFNHSLPVLKNGLHEDFFPDRKLKSRYTMINNKLEGDFYYMSADKQTYYYQFRNGEFDGNSYLIGPAGKWLKVSKHNKGDITETIEYKIDSSAYTKTDFSRRSEIDSFVSRQKIITYHRLYLPDRSTLTKLWHVNEKPSHIQHKDSTGKTLFSTRYFEKTGTVEGSEIFDVNSGISTYTGYYENGVIERKLIWYPDKTRVSYFYNPDGTLKNTEN